MTFWLADEQLKIRILLGGAILLVDIGVLIWYLISKKPKQSK